ncbi:hypothetical protein M0R45_000445 [Rubus argutus]|uniref:C-JID domain-containing protein n=1 Tax=Rubus argutus TaxID=59490 RepID=A0AAW1VQN5_RUBAR
MKVLDKLKYIELSDSESLIETPDFTGAPNLEILIFEDDEGRLRIIRRSRSRMCWMEISKIQCLSWLQRYHQDTLRMSYGLSFTGANIIPEWFNHQSSNSSVSVQLPTEFDTTSRQWIAYTLYVDFVALGDFDARCDFKLMHKFDCFYNTKNGPCYKHTLSHEQNVEDVPVGSNGYWISIPHLWFSQQLTDFNECCSIEAYTRVNSTTVEVTMTGARLLYQQDFKGFVEAIKCDERAVRIRKNKKEHSGGEIKSTLKEQGGEFTSIYSDSSKTNLSIFVEDQGCKIDSTLSLSQLLESLPLRCYEGRRYSGVKYYVIEGKFTNPQTALTLEKIVQEYSGQHDFRYSDNFLQSEIPESFCCVKGPSATFALNASLDSIIGWKGIAICVSVAMHKHPSLILDDLYSENPYIIHCRLESSNGWTMRMFSKITKSEAFGLKRVGLIWMLYRSRGTFSDGMLKGCTSMNISFYPNNKDLTIRSCGYQIISHQNVDELVETMMLCSRNQHNDDEEGDGDDGEEDDNVITL